MEQRESGECAGEHPHRLGVRPEAEPLDPGEVAGEQARRLGVGVTHELHPEPPAGPAVQDGAGLDQLDDAAGARQVSDVDDAGVVGRTRRRGDAGGVGHHEVRSPEALLVAVLGEEEVDVLLGAPLEVAYGVRRGPRERGRQPRLHPHAGGGVLVDVPDHRREVEPPGREEQLGVVEEHQVVVGGLPAQQGASGPQRAHPVPAASPGEVDRA